MRTLSRPPERAKELAAGEGGAGRAGNVASAALWTLSSLAGMNLLRLGSQIALSYLLLPAHFGAIALMRTFLTLVEMLSDFGIRNAVLYHPRGAERGFLDTAWTVQIVRGLGMWLLACALAWPAATFYDQPLLLWLLPVAGLESVNNGSVSVRIYLQERRLELAVPILLEGLALVFSLLTSLVWASVSPGVWALAAGPLVGGFARALASHWLYRRTPARLAWQREHARALVSFGRWVIWGTMVSFIAQQFHVLYLAKFLPLAILGVYNVAWGFCAQASKPLTMLANRVIIPHFAEFQRRSREQHSEAVRASLANFLPACLLVCVCAALFSPALFGFFYERAFVDGGRMGRQLAIVAWFMVLQQVPRSVLLSLGGSREVAVMALWNAVLTVVGIVLGFTAGGGSVPGAIWGNALGNVAGCASGALAMRRRGLFAGQTMVAYSLVFLVLSQAGAALASWAGGVLGVSESLSSLLATLLAGTTLGAWVWWRAVMPFLAARRAGREPLLRWNPPS